MLLLRDARKEDRAALATLAAELDSVNLPHDPRALARIIERSCRSFSGALPPRERSYVFVLEDPARRRVIGTSMIIAQHGTRESPCTFFDVSEREHYSSTLDRHFRHRVLSIGYHFDGPTEIGGLVVHPGDRGGPEKPGKQLVYVRFLYLAAHRRRFREKVLAELMPPLLPDGRSAFWEACGARFTGLDYHEADKLSRANKEFIQQLFPPGDLYATLFPPAVETLLGAVGPETQPVKRLLERIGFRYVDRIDPFDGGPHYEARVEDITLVRAYRRAKLAAEPLPADAARPRWLVAVQGEARGDGRFRAVCAPATFDAGGSVRLPPEAIERLQAGTGERLHAIPFDDVA